MGKLPRINRNAFTVTAPGPITADVSTGVGMVLRARVLRKRPTEAEQRLWYALRLLKPLGLHFRRQVPIGRYVADFACHRAKIIVELDGAQHGEPDGVRQDAERTAFLNTRGYRVLRFWNGDVLAGCDDVVEGVLRAAGVW